VQVDLEAAVAPKESAVAWLGFEAKRTNETLRFPVCSGWVAGSKAVVTTGELIAFLQTQHNPNKGFRVFVYLPQTERIVYVSGFKLHPHYRPDSADNISPHNNLGMALVDETLAVACPWTRNPTGKVDGGTEVLVRGFLISEEMQRRPYDQASPLKLVRSRTRIVAGDAADSSVPFPRRVLDLKSPAGLDGAPVFGVDGQVLGIVLQIQEKSYAVLCAGLAGLMD
jgi:hypothetical protein